MTKPTEYMGPSEAAEYLGVARSTFYRMLRRGELAGVRMYQPTERRPMFNRADLEAWKAAREHDAGQKREEKD